MYKIVTGQINRESIINLLSQFLQPIMTYWGNQLKVAHGGVSNIEIAKQFMYKVISTNDLISHIVNEEKVVDFTIGEWDYFLSNLTENESIQLCHESDIHFEIQSISFKESIISILENNGNKFWIEE